jgi:hypothetical protein
MSITLGGYTVETKKTVGELPAGSDNIIAEAPCDDTINLATVQPVWKKIHEYTRTIIADPNLLTGGWEIIPSSRTLPDDVFADGFDYEIDFIFNYIGSSPSLNVQLQRFSYTVGGNNWFQNVNSGDTIIMNESNCGGSYANTARALVVSADDLVPFTLEVTFYIRQLIPATIEIELCGGGNVIHLTELEETSEVINVFIGDGEDPLSESVNSTKRNTTYDPYDLGFTEIAKMPQTCLGYSVYYIGHLFSSPYTSPLDKTYFLDNGIYETKINIPIVPPQALDFKFYDSIAYYFTGLSDSNGLLDWTPLDLSNPALTFNMSLELWNGGIKELSSGEQYVYFKYDLASYDCPCDECGDSCGGITIIFHQSCGNAYPLKFNLMIQEGNYTIEGETFTQGGAIIRPVTKVKATYDLVLSEYSDETYLLLMELLADNVLIEVVDNIDVSNPTTEYYIDTDSLTPTWNFNSKLGTIVIPVIRKDTIRTSRRNCCG